MNGWIIKFHIGIGPIGNRSHKGYNFSYGLYLLIENLVQIFHLNEVVTGLLLLLLLLLPHLNLGAIGWANVLP
jgi:hypothetical protein